MAVSDVDCTKILPRTIHENHIDLHSIEFTRVGGCLIGLWIFLQGILNSTWHILWFSIFAGGLGPAAININAITAGLHSNSNGDKGFFESRGVVNAGVTPSFGVDAMGRVAITWQYQRKGAQQ